MEGRIEELSRRFPGEVPRPSWWGSYRLVPVVIEIWVGGGALHDRVEYQRSQHGSWSSRRLSP